MSDREKTSRESGGDLRRRGCLAGRSATCAVLSSSAGFNPLKEPEEKKLLTGNEEMYNSAVSLSFQQKKCSPSFPLPSPPSFPLPSPAFSSVHAMPDLKNLPYDSVYKDFFGRAAMVRSLLQLFCPPDFVNNLDFSSLRACPTSFVTDRFLLLHCDSAWCLRLKDRPDCWVGVIIAFQTRRDPLMPLRLLACSSLVQMALFHGKAGNGKITGENDLLVQILPIIIYRGEEEWNVPMETEACVASGVEYLKEFSPQHRFVLLDEKLMSREILEASDQVAAQFFLLSQTDDPEMILKTVKRLTELPDGNDPDSLNALFTDFLRNIVLVKAGITDTGVMSADLQGVKNMIEANLPQWKRDCFQKGWDEGNAEGKLEALHEAVRRKLKALFGDLPEAVQSAIDQTTDVEILYTVLSPVGESKTLPHYMEQLASGRTAAVNQ